MGILLHISDQPEDGASRMTVLFEGDTITDEVRDALAGCLPPGLYVTMPGPDLPIHGSERLLPTLEDLPRFLPAIDAIRTMPKKFHDDVFREPAEPRTYGDTFVYERRQPGRNQPCSCGSQKKFKNCHLHKNS